MKDMKLGGANPNLEPKHEGLKDSAPVQNVTGPNADFQPNRGEPLPGKATPLKK